MNPLPKCHYESSKSLKQFLYIYCVFDPTQHEFMSANFMTSCKFRHFIWCQISWLCQVSNIFHICLLQKPILHGHPPSGRTVERCPDSGWKIPARLAWNRRKFEKHPPEIPNAVHLKKREHLQNSTNFVRVRWFAPFGKGNTPSSTKTPAIFGFHVNSNWGVVGYRKFNSFGGWTFTLKLNPCTDWFKLVVIGCFLGYVAGNLSNRSQSNRKHHPLKGAGCLVHPRKTNMNMKKKRQFWRCISYEKWVIFYCQPCWFTGGIPKVTP